MQRQACDVGQWEEGNAAEASPADRLVCEEDQACGRHARETCISEVEQSFFRDLPGRRDGQSKRQRMVCQTKKALLPHCILHITCSTDGRPAACRRPALSRAHAKLSHFSTYPIEIDLTVFFDTTDYARLSLPPHLQLPMLQRGKMVDGVRKRSPPGPRHALLQLARRYMRSKD